MRDPIRAELVGDDIATALDITARSSTPIIRLCAMLIEAGLDPAARLHVYRGNTLALTVRSIGEGAQLVINGRGTWLQPRPCVKRARAMSRYPAPPLRCSE
jgi:hypothetical protein